MRGGLSTACRRGSPPPVRRTAPPSLLPLSHHLCRPRHPAPLAAELEAALGGSQRAAMFAAMQLGFSTQEQASIRRWNLLASLLLLRGKGRPAGTEEGG